MQQQGMKLKRTSPKAICQTGKQMLHVYEVNVTTAQHSHLDWVKEAYSLKCDKVPLLDTAAGFILTNAM